MLEQSDAERRRRETLVWAHARGLSLPDVPLLEDARVLRDSREVADRCLCLQAVVASAQGCNRIDVLRWLGASDLRLLLTERELDFVLHGPNRHDEYSLQCCEAVTLLGWSLHALPRYDPAAPDTDARLLSALPCPGDSLATARFKLRGRLRDTEQLLAVRDRLYCLVSAERSRSSRSGPGLPGISSAALSTRWRALDWLFRQGRWGEAD